MTLKDLNNKNDIQDLSIQELLEKASMLNQKHALSDSEYNNISKSLREISQKLDEVNDRNFTIRTAKISDIDELEKMVQYWAAKGENLPRKRNDIMRNIQTFVVCIKDGMVCGCACLFVYDSGLAEIRSLGVSPYVQRQGQGRAIVEFLLKKAHKMEIKKVFVLTRNPEFFSKVGFSKTVIEALPEKILKDCENCPKKDRCDEVAYEYNFKD